jgi:hypothetical protein
MRVTVMRIRAALTFALLALGACHGAGEAAGGPWISQSPGSVRQPDASVAAAANGLVAMVWIDVAQAGSSAVGYAFSTDGGSAFAPASVLASPGGAIASDPTVVAGADQSFSVSWVGYQADALGNPSNMHVYVARAEPGATAFGAPVEVTDPADPSSYDKPWIKLTGAGGLVITYQRVAAPLDVGVVLARSQDGVTWDRAFVADDPSGAVFRNLAYACASPDGERLWVTYLAGETTFDVRLARSDDGGATWAPEILVSAPGDPVAFDDPSCVAGSDDEVWVAYGLTGDAPFSSASVQKLDAVVLARSSDGGATVAARAAVQDAAAARYFMHPQLAGAAGGALDLVYYAGASGDDPDGSFRWSHAADPEAGFAPSVAVGAPIVFLQARADPRWVGDYPGVFTRGSDVYMGYAVNASGEAHAAFARATSP